MQTIQMIVVVLAGALTLLGLDAPTAAQTEQESYGSLGSEAVSLVLAPTLSQTPVLPELKVDYERLKDRSDNLERAAQVGAPGASTNPSELPRLLRSSKNQLAIYALSRAGGVPPPAWQALEQLRGYFAKLHSEGTVTRIEETRIGLEGETRLCVEFATEKAALGAFEHVGRLTQGIDLIDVKAELCIS